jgi:hypothetical protein
VVEGKRCRRNGFGNPPLCREHAVSSALDLEAGSPLVDMLGEGDRWVSRQQDPLVATAAGVLAWAIMGIATGRGRPPGVAPPGGFGFGDPFRRAAAGPRAPTGGQRRPRPQPPRPSEPPPPDPIQRAREVLNFGPEEPLTKDAINSRRRQLATVFHPDRQGGGTAAMQRINQAADLLLAKVA